uniref:Uncharacterized protein n=1 Tax=Anguilla anguilla TaxID=7936 RepID=A0A0E9TTM7_ANGAN
MLIMSAPGQETLKLPNQVYAQCKF